MIAAHQKTTASAKSVNLVAGLKIGRLTAISKSHCLKSAGWYWKFKCDCGTEKIIRSYNVRIGAVVSCGCYRLQRISEIKTTHGMRWTSEYSTWHDIKDRCGNPKNSGYKHYGGRGIRVCKRWIKSFQNFIFDMGLKPSSKSSIERKNNNGNYAPKNCRWATMKEQAQNRRGVIKIKYLGKIKSLSEWCSDLGLNRGLIRSRIRRQGWSFECAILTPKLK